MQNVGLYQLGIFLHAKGKDSPVTGLAAKTKKNNGGEGSGRDNGPHKSRRSTDFKPGLIQFF